MVHRIDILNRYLTEQERYKLEGLPRTNCVEHRDEDKDYNNRGDRWQHTVTHSPTAFRRKEGRSESSVSV